MRRACLLFVILISLFCLPYVRTEARAETLVLGRNPRQIAAMGIIRWTDHYCARKQWTTASQAEAAAIFGASLHQVNNERLSAGAVSARDQAAIRAIRALATTYSTALLEIAARQGGTMWIPMRAGVPAAVEGLVADLIPLLRRKTPVSTASAAARRETVRRLIATTEAGLRQADAVVREPGGAGQAANVEKARQSFAAVQRQFAKPSWPGSVVLLEWFAVRSRHISEND